MVKKGKYMRKRLIILLTFVILACALGLTACKNDGHKCEKGICGCGKIDYNYVAEGLEFDLINNGTEYQVESYLGQATKIVIPKIYNDIPVTTIKKDVFTYSASLEKVAISNSVKTIEKNAFFSCKVLEEVVFEKDSQLSSIGDYAFGVCESLKSIEIPDSVTRIGEYAFRGCTSLRYNVKDGAKYLGNIENPYMYLEEIAKNDITEITIDRGCKIVGIYAFLNCVYLTKVTVPNSTMVMHSNVFFNCPSLTIYCEALERPEGWKSDWNFSDNPVIWDCINNKTAHDGYIYTAINGLNYGVKAGQAVVSKQLTTIKEAKIPETVTYNGEIYTVTSIGDEAFSNCKSLRSVVMPDSIIKVGKNAFAGCNSLTYITSNGLKYLGSANNPHLYLLDATTTEITFANINSNCKIIGAEALAGCSLLQTIQIPQGITNIGYKAFSGCTSLKSIQIPSSLIYLGDQAFNECTKLTYNTKGGLKYLPSNDNPYFCLIEKENASASDFSVDSNCKLIAPYAFADCTALTRITIPASVMKMGENIFYNCTALTVYCEALSQTEDWVYNWNAQKNPVVWDCNNNNIAEDGNIYALIDGLNYALKDGKATVVKQLSSVVEAKIPATVTYLGSEYSVTGIGAQAFAVCDSLTTATIPHSVMFVDNTAFENCESLTIYCESANQPAGWGALWNSAKNPVIWDCKNNTLADDGSYYIVLDGVSYSLKNGYATVVRQTRTLTKATIPAAIIYGGSSYDVVKITDKAFYGCTLLASITIPAGVNYIGDEAFYNCKLLKSIPLPENLTYIGEKAFYNCTSLEKLVIPMSVLKIGIYAFINCDSLADITFERVTIWRKTDLKENWGKPEMGSGYGISEDGNKNATNLRNPSTYGKYYLYTFA